jgi:hypothetical protein
MRRVILPALLLAAVVFSQTTGSVEGVVENSVTRVGIAGVTVTVYMRSGGLYEATTDASGDFRIFGMKPGNYEVRFEKEGFIQGQKIPSQPYPVGQAQDPVRMRLGMIQEVSLSGRVVDGDGNPVSQVDVKLLNRNSVPASRDGTFVFDRLEPGSYTLVAMPKSAGASEGARVPVTTYFPSSLDAAGAQPILIRGDSDVSGYEIRLQTAEAYRIRGVVLDETGNPKAGVPVQLLPNIQTGTRVVTFGNFITMVGPGPSTGPEEARVISGDDGSFEFLAVRSGEWKLAALSTGSIEAVDFAATVRSGALTVIVGNRNVANVQVRLAAPIKVTGTVDWGDLPNRSAAVSLIPVGGLSVLLGPPMGGSSGTLSLRASATGKHLIVPQAGPGYYPVSVLLGGQEVLGKPVDLFPDATFRVAYKAATGSVHGTVENGDGAMAVLVSRDVQTMGFGRMVICKTDGSFDMSGVPPGDYFAVAFEQLQRTFPTADAAWLAEVASVGTRVSVAQSPVSVQLKPVRWPE